MEKVTKFFKGDPAEADLLGLGSSSVKGPKIITEQREKEWLKGRDEARKNPPPFALVQNPKVYDK